MLLVFQFLLSSMRSAIVVMLFEFWFGEVGLLESQASVKMLVVLQLPNFFLIPWMKLDEALIRLLTAYEQFKGLELSIARFRGSLLYLAT